MAETQKVAINLYDHTIQVVYYPTSHQYKIDWKNIISVSSISWVVDKPHLLKWVSDLCIKTLESYLKDGVKINMTHVIEAATMYKAKQAEAKYAGTIVHDWIEAYSKWLNPDIPEMNEKDPDPQIEQARNWILAFLKWKDENNVKFIKQEVFVYSKKYGYGGRFDAIIEIDWAKYLVDYKTSKSFYEMEYDMQTWWYLQAYNEELAYLVDKWYDVSDSIVDSRMILMFGKETWEFSVHKLTDLNTAISCFNAAHILLKRKKEVDAKQKAAYLESKNQ